MVSVMKLEKAPEETYADIGGLDQQIQEIKVFLPLLSVLGLHSLPSSGISGAATDPPRVLRGDGHSATKGCHLVWSSRHRQNLVGQGRGQPYFSHLLEGVWLRADTEVSGKPASLGVWDS